MKVQELRNLIKTADRGLLEKAFVETYKQLRKDQKGETDVLIAGILDGKDVKDAAKEPAVNFADLAQQIKDFIENAYAQNYFAPNRVIPKNQRPKWRFLVKNYIKELSKVPAESENYPQMVKLLTDLYRVICCACNYYLFSTEDPFRSIGWAQPDLYQLLAKKVFLNGYSKENISAMLLCACTGGLSRESLNIQQQMCLLNELKTSDTRYMAIEEAKKLVEERKTKLMGIGKNSHSQFDIEEEIDHFCDMILILQTALAEPDVEYYFKNCKKRDREIILYRALDLVDWLGNDQAWMQIYNWAVKKKIKPRKSLVEKYESLI